MNDQFKVSIQVELQDRFSAGLKAMSHAMGAVHTQMSGINTYMSKFKNIQNQYSQIASLGRSIQTAGLDGLKAVLDPAKEYAHQLNLMNMNGLKHLEIQKNIAAAWKTAGDVPTSTPASNLAALMDLRTVFVGKNASQEGRDLLTTFQKAQTMLDASAHTLKGHSSHDMVFSMAKAIEMMGQLDPKKFEHHMNQMARVMVASGGRVTPENYQNTLKYARMAKMNLGDDFLYTKLPELIIEMQNAGGKGGGGGGPGAMIAAAFRQTVMGILNKAAAGNLSQLGLLKNPTLKTTTTGTTVVGTDGVRGDKLFAEDPERWVNTMLVPALISHHKAQAGDTKGILMAIAQTFKGNQNAITLYQELYSKQKQFGKFGSNLAGVPGIDKSYENSQKDADQQFKNLDGALNTLRTSIGVNALPIIVPGVIALAKAIGQAAQFIHSHPIIGQTIAGFMVAMTVVGGAISHLSALLGTALAFKMLGLSRVMLLFTGWIGAALLVVTAITVAIMNWDKVMKFVHGAVTRFKGILLDLSEKFPPLKIAIGFVIGVLRTWRDEMGWVAAGFQKFWNTIMNAIKGAMGGIGNWFMNVPNQKAVDAKWTNTFGGGGGKSTPTTVTQNFNTTVHVKGHEDMKKIGREIAASMHEETRRQVASNPLAGGNHTSVHFAGAH